MNSGHVLIDRKGAILEADAAFGWLVQAEPSALRGRDVLSLTADADRSECDDAIRELLATGRSFDMTKRFVRQDTSVLWVRNSVSLMTIDRGTVLVATCAAASAPDVRRMPIALLASARAEMAKIEDRQRVGDPRLLSQPNWTLLLQVFIAEAEGRAVNLAALKAHYGHSHDVVRRWLGIMVGAGLIEVETRAADPYSEKSYRLTTSATERLEAYLSRYARDPHVVTGEPLI